MVEEELHCSELICRAKAKSRNVFTRTLGHVEASPPCFFNLGSMPGSGKDPAPPWCLGRWVGHRSFGLTVPAVPEVWRDLSFVSHRRRRKNVASQRLIIYTRRDK